MRQGVNPEKIKNEKNKRYWHRVIIPVYIPNITEVYYSNMLEVFEFCLQSVIKSININTTALTIINNNSVNEVDEIIKTHLESIDKYVYINENKGKVYTVLNEARAVYESFVTISDADVYFEKGWENEVFKIFKEYDRAGVVAPLACQGLAFNHNYTLFFDNFLLGKVKYNKVVSDKDCELYIKGLGNNSILNRNNKYNWKEKQYYLDKKVKAIIGCGHFVATYRSSLFSNQKNFPELKFKNGYEDSFIDVLGDKKGYYRLSTVKSFAYHMGNKIDNNYLELKNDLIEKQVPFNEIRIRSIRNSIPYEVKKIVFKIIKKIFKL